MLKIKVFIVFLFIISLSFYKGANAQISSPRFEHITINEGLSQSAIKVIHQDKIGFMWFGTNDGLNRYDGYSFRIFKHEVYDSSTISDNDILDISEDSDGYLWVATLDGLNRYDPFYESFKRFDFNNRIRGIEFSNAVISVLGFNDQKEKIVWFSTRNGVFRYDIEKDSLKMYAVNNGSQAGNIDTKIFLQRDRSNSLIAVTNMNGIYKYDISTDKFKRIKIGNPSEEVQLSPIYQDEDNIWWFGSIKGLNKYNPATGELNQYKTRFEKKVDKKFNTQFINDIAEDNNGNLWLATSGYGLISFNRHSEKINVYSHDPYDQRTISFDVSNTVFKDRGGIIWIGTHGDGIDKLNPYVNNFNYTKRTVNGFSINSVRTFFEDTKGYLWISGYTGLDRYDFKTGKYKSYYSESDIRPANRLNSVVYSVEGDKDNPQKYIYFGTEGKGIYRYDMSKEIFTEIYSSPKSYGSNIILCMYDDGIGSLWFGTKNGLVKLDKSTGIYVEYTYNQNNPYSIKPQFVTAIFEDSFNNFWIGTNQGGLNLMDRENGTFKSFNVNPDEENFDINSENQEGFISGNFVKCIFEDENKNLWIGTTSGLNKFVRESNTFIKYTIQNGLPNNVIYGILEDDKGNLWLSTNFGISRFNPENESFKNFDYTNGLQSNEFNTNAYYKTRNGLMLFGGIKGFNSFYPEQIKENKKIPPVIITGLRLFNKPVLIGQNYNGREILHTSITTTDSIELYYEENVFTIEFAALDYSSTTESLYKYKLEGFDNDWSKASRQRTVTYTNLYPGKYIFKVTGSNNDDVWNQEGAMLFIRVEPPFWLTWWFYSIAALILFGIVYLFYRVRVTKLLEVERLRMKIASDLHDEVGSTLTKVSMRAQMLEMQSGNESEKKGLQRIAEQARETVSTMQDIVWAIDSRNDSVKDLLLKMQDTARSVLFDKNIFVDFSVNGLDEASTIPPHIRQNVYLIMKEAVHNIAKHSNATKVEITLNNSGDEFEMKISDNGTEFEDKEYTTGQGLKNMKMRAEKIKGKIYYSYEQGFAVLLKAPAI